MDHLNRHTYRALLQQAQQTIDQNFVKIQEQKLMVTEKTMEELNFIFNRFGLTPTDMNIPWHPDSAKSLGVGGGGGGGGGANVQFEVDEDDDISDGGSPSVPSVPMLNMASKALPNNNNRSNPLKSGKSQPEDGGPQGRVKIPGKLIVYHPSSWRHELASKKDKGVPREVQLANIINKNKYKLTHFCCF